MVGKRSADALPESAEGTVAASGDSGEEGEASRKRQTLELSVDGAAGSAEAVSCGGDGGDGGAAPGGAAAVGQEVVGSVLSPMTMCFSMQCDESELAGRKAALAAAVEAAVSTVVAEFGGREVRVEWTRSGPSEDTLTRVLPFVLKLVRPDRRAQCFQVCMLPQRLARGRLLAPSPAESPSF